LTNSKIYQVFSASYPEAAISTTRNLTVLWDWFSTYSRVRRERIQEHR
jgi:hypothetical protein